MTAFHFLRPAWLLALLPALLLWWVLRRRTDTTWRWRAAIDPALLRHLVVATPSGHWLLPGDALLAGWVLAALSVAGPAWQREPSPFAAEAPPLMLVVRVTPSMMDKDLPPSRLGRATEKIIDLLALNPREPVGLVAYAGSAHLVLPPTRDPSVVETMAAALSPEIMPRQGDALAGAVALARQVLSDGGDGGAILVLADEARTDQVALLRAVAPGAPVSVLAMLPPGRAVGAGLRDAAAALNADVELVRPDRDDVEALARRFARPTAGATRTGDTERWRDAGWYLVPVLALLVLLWFRRGWVVLS